MIARNSSFTYKKQSVDIKEVGRKLGVRHVLEGSVRQAGMRVRITGQLIDARTGGHVWAERYDRDLEDIFLVQDEVTRKIVQTLEVTLTGSERARREDRGKVNGEAYDYLIRGEELHPAVQRGRAGRGACHAGARTGHRPGAGAGLRVPGDRSMAPSTRTAGTIARPMTWSERLARGAQGVRARCVRSGWRTTRWPSLLMWLRRLDEAEECGAAGRGARPELLRRPMGRWATCCTFAGSTSRRSSRWSRRFGSIRNSTCGCIRWDGRCSSLGRYAEAEAMFKRRLIHMPASDVTRAYLASLYGHTGRQDEARRVWSELMAINPRYTIEHTLRVLPYAGPSAFEHFVQGLRKVGLAQ